MKNVQISQDLFINLVKYHLAEMYEVENHIKKELEKKLDSLVKRQYYTQYKTGDTEIER